MTITLSKAASVSAGTPTDLDLRRQVRELRRQVRELRGERDVLVEQVAERTAQAHAETAQRSLLRAEDAELLAYARATVAAVRDGEPNPLSILAGLLEERGQLPAPEQRSFELLAQGYRAPGGAA